MLTHRCDGAVLSDRCGYGLSAVHAQAVRRYIELLTQQGEERTKGKWYEQMGAANRNGRLIAYLGHRRVLLQQLCHDERPAIHVKALSAVVQGVHSVLAKLIDMDSDVLVLAAKNNGAQCLVCRQGLRDGLSALWTQLVPGSIELLTKGKQGDRGEKRQSERGHSN